MRNSITFAVILSSMMICSCKQSAQNANKVVVVNDDDAIEVNFEDVATDVQVVPILGDIIIGECYEMQCYGNELFIHDGRNAIYYFIDNVFKSKLYSVGRGPGEYINIRQFAYSVNDKILYIKPTNGKEILWYSVPEMKYLGKTRLKEEANSIFMHNDTMFLVSSNNDSLSSVQLIGKYTGNVIKKITDIYRFAEQRSYKSMSGYGPNSRILSIAGYENSIYTLSENGKLKPIFRFGFGKKSIPEKYLNAHLYEKQKIMDYMSFIYSSSAEKCLYGGFFCKQEKNGLSFWYSKFFMGSDKLCYYRHTKNSDTNLKGFHVPGLKKPILPMCVTDEGYIMAFEGTSDMIIDPDTEPSPLAKQIIKAMDAQRDENPVLVYFDIK